MAVNSQEGESDIAAPLHRQKRVQVQMLDARLGNGDSSGYRKTSYYCFCFNPG